MATTMRCNKFVREANTLQVEFDLLYDLIMNINATYSPQYCICGLVQLQVRRDLTRAYDTNTYKTDVSIKFLTLHQDEDLIYFIKLSSNVFKLKDKIYFSDDTDWRLIYSSDEHCTMIDISVVMDVAKRPSFFKYLSEDKSTDFQLRGKDGSVDVHRAVLSAYSPVLRAMLAGEWRERGEGVMQVSDASQETLQHLRDYMYLHQLPDVGLEPLLSHASAYMMTELMKSCSVKLLFKLNDENHVDLLELAIKYKSKLLYLGIIESVKHEVIKPTATTKYLMLISGFEVLSIQ